MQKKLLLEVYSEAGIDPSTVSYVELHGTGTAAGDPQEANSVTEVFCSNGRFTPLLVGSTKSNMGHPEPASGLAALAKVLIAIHDHAIPANLHYSQPNPDIPGLVDGRLKVIVYLKRFMSTFCVCFCSCLFCVSFSRVIVDENPQV